MCGVCVVRYSDMAPEMLKLRDAKRERDRDGGAARTGGLRGYGLEVDVYSAGVVLGQLLFEYQEDDVADLDNHRAKGPAFARRCQEALRSGGDGYAAHELCIRMLEEDPRRRISVAEALRHRYFADGAKRLPRTRNARDREELSERLAREHSRERRLAHEEADRRDRERERADEEEDRRRAPPVPPIAVSGAGSAVGAALGAFAGGAGVGGAAPFGGLTPAQRREREREREGRSRDPGAAAPGSAVGLALGAFGVAGAARPSVPALTPAEQRREREREERERVERERERERDRQRPVVRTPAKNAAVGLAAAAFGGL